MFNTGNVTPESEAEQPRTRDPALEKEGGGDPGCSQVRFLKEGLRITVTNKNCALGTILFSYLFGVLVVAGDQT